MLKVDVEKVDNGQSTLMNLSLGVEESGMLDSVIDKLLTEPHKEEELRLEHGEILFLMNLALKIGQSGMRQYIESEDK